MARQLLNSNKKHNMKVRILIATVLFLGGNTYSQTLADAIKKTDNERFSDAANSFKILIEREPANASNYYYFGENYFAKKELDSAVLMWTKSSEVDAISPISIVAKGRCLWIKGNKEAAKAEFTKVLTQTKNKNPEILRAIADIYVHSEIKSLDEAIALLDVAIKLDPQNEDGHLLMGDALLEKTPQNGSPAIKSYNKVLEINPKSPRGIVRVAKLYQRAQNYELANEKYKEAQTVDPTYAPAYRENAELNMMFKQSSKAIENWKKYLELNNSTEARYRFATAMYEGKQYCDVIPEIEYLQGKMFNNYYMERMLTNSYLECGKDSEAIKKGLSASDRFFSLVPQDKVLFTDYKYRGLLLSKSGSDSLAVIELTKASSINAEAAKELAGDIGRLNMKMKKYDKAIQSYEFKQSNGKLSITEQFELASAYFKGPQDFVKADTTFAMVLVQSPTYYPAAYYRARCAITFDPTKTTWKAKPYYDKVIELVKPEERANKNNKAMVIEASKYMGDYYINSKEKDSAKAIQYWTIVKELDPADKQAAAFFKANGN